MKAGNIIAIVGFGVLAFFVIKAIRKESAKEKGMIAANEVK
jgi:hypothetical protein